MRLHQGTMTPSSGCALARLAAVIVLLLVSVSMSATTLADEATPGRVAPHPVDEEGRALALDVELLNVDRALFDELVDGCFALERDGAGRVFARVSAEQIQKLRVLGVIIQELEEPSAPEIDADYHDHTALSAALQQVAADHPAIARLVSGGPSHQGRELWWLRISDAPDLEEDEPGFKYISTIHGDEPVGTELLLRLINVLTDGYGVDPRATRLVDELEIWIMPMMNPDGNAVLQRENAQGYDLNRSFPDKWVDPLNTTEGRPTEVARLMDWQRGHATSLSANLHGGALVVNYPFDNNEQGTSTFSPTPDEDIVVDVSLEYSEDNPPMYNGAWPQGITNGAAWYRITGGMQDWNYDYHGDVQLTLELSNTKRPPASELDRHWQENEESLISFMERALTGVRGVVRDAETDLPVAARLHVEGRGSVFYTDPEVGDFQRIMPAGSHELVVRADGYEEARVPFTVTDAEADAVRADVRLVPRETSLEAVGARLDDETSGDGFLEAGESGRLAVTLENLGRTARGVTGSLVPVSSHATSEGSGTWPDLAPGASAESDAPHLAIAAASSAPPGHQLAYAVAWSTAEGVSGLSEPLFVPLGAPTIEDHAASDVPLAILDLQTTTSSVGVIRDDEIAEVDVGVQIDHTYVGDLIVTLRAPDGTEVRLHDRQGGSSDDIRTWYDDETEPAEDLGVLRGKPSAGTWTLIVDDRANGDTGTLESWTLRLNTRPYADPIDVVLLRGLRVDELGNVELVWWPVGGADGYAVYRSNDPSSAEAFADVTSEDDDATDTRFVDQSEGALVCWIITASNRRGEGPWGHFGR